MEKADVHDAIRVCALPAIFICLFLHPNGIWQLDASHLEYVEAFTYHLIKRIHNDQ